MLTTAQKCDHICSYVHNYAYGLGECKNQKYLDVTKELFYQHFGFTYNCGWVCPSVLQEQDIVIDPPIEDEDCIQLQIDEDIITDCILPFITVLP